MSKVLISSGGLAMASLTTLALMPSCETPIIFTWYASIALSIIFCVSAFICLIIGIVYFKRYLVYLLREYQKPPSHTGGGLSPLKGIRIGTKYEFTTMNERDVKMEYEEPIQAVHFIKPVEKTVYPDKLPAFVNCEISMVSRWRNKVFGIPIPRIKVKQFTERGIIYDEENTYGVDGVLEFIPKSPQSQ